MITGTKKYSQVLDGKSKPTPFLKVPLYGETVEDAIRDLLDVDVSVDEDCLHLGWVYLKIWKNLCISKKSSCL